MQPLNRHLTLAFVFIIAIGASGQERFEKGDLRGFTRSPTEHIINDLEVPLRVCRVEGVINFGEHGPIEEALFEIRGPGKSEVVRGAITDSRGRFKPKHVKQGEYAFKATKNGFQSLVGKIVVEKCGRNPKPIVIDLHIGV